ncbi:hypothetical protein FD755_017663 [Muntiacus reevesi]|uniref:Uncharacterized protein n=2 Tax=Muntiacus reevesi TaxID=9886 RepID=A0A5N3XBC1_MUNRE|nr:hypothetical protein FD755_017663 [Muntiacus reevesi]
MEPRDGSPEARSSDSESASASSSGSERDAGPEPDKAPRRLSKRRFPGLRLFGHS